MKISTQRKKREDEKFRTWSARLRHVVELPKGHTPFKGTVVEVVPVGEMPAYYYPTLKSTEPKKNTSIVIQHLTDLERFRWVELNSKKTKLNYIGLINTHLNENGK